MGRSLLAGAGAPLLVQSAAWALAAAVLPYILASARRGALIGVWLAGLLAGDLAVGDFIIALVPSYWTIAMLAIQYSGIMSCSDEEKITAMKRDARLCVEFGDYCSRCINVFGRCVACLERTKSYCCFNSHLARIINEQGRAQVGKTWGSDTARNPDCSGFSVAQLRDLQGRLEHQAYHDPLTGLANRTLFLERLVTFVDDDHGRRLLVLRAPITHHVTAQRAVGVPAQPAMAHVYFHACFAQAVQPSAK